MRIEDSLLPSFAPHPMKALRALIRPSNGRPESLAHHEDGGMYACSEELRTRWHEQDDQGCSRLEAELARIRDGERGAEVVVDLRGACLVDAQLAGLELAGADLRGADLSRADLRGTRLFQADLQGAVLFQARLDGADLTGARLHGTNLESASLKGASLGAADLTSAKLINAKLGDANLSRANLRGAQLSSASFRSATMLDACLVNTDFAHADLRECALNRSEVTGACFDEADMRGAHLHRLQGVETARWVGADLREVDFAGAHMTRRFIVDQNYIEEFRARSPLTNKLYHAWSLTSDCGRSMSRWGFCTFLIASLFATTYHLVDIDYGDQRTWFSPFYFSVVTLTTLGYGDILPVSATAQMLVVLEVSIGYVMLGGFISILSNKLARRAD